MFGHWVTGQLLPGAQYFQSLLARWRRKDKHCVIYANSCTLGNRLRKWDARCSTSQNKSLDKKLDGSFISPFYGKAHEFPSCVPEDVCCLYSSLPCFQVWAINPLISVLINSPIKNLDIERDKYNVGGVKLRSAHWDRANSNPRELSRAQPEWSCHEVFWEVCPQDTWDEWLPSLFQTHQAVWKTKSPATSS